jgi:hypothetical protein
MVDVRNCKVAATLTSGSWDNVCNFCYDFLRIQAVYSAEDTSQSQDKINVKWLITDTTLQDRGFVTVNINASHWKTNRCSWIQSAQLQPLPWYKDITSNSHTVSASDSYNKDYRGKEISPSVQTHQPHRWAVGRVVDPLSDWVWVC